MSIPPVLHRLLTAAGPSGYETAPAAVFREAAEEFAEVSTDVMGSVRARVPGTAGGRRVAIVGHIDEIGLIVTHIDDDGFLFFIGVGGWDPPNLVGQRVDVMTKDGVVPGVIGKKPIHLLKGDARDKPTKLEELHIDIGAKKDDEPRARIGDVAVISGEPVELPNDRAISRSMDNRLGCYVAYEAARLVAEAGGAPGDVVAVAAVQEEITFGGSRTTAHDLQPDVAIVVDVTFATDQPGIDVKELGKHELGSGPVLERGSILNPVVFELLHDTAKKHEVDVTISSSAGRTGTDADAIHLTRSGIPCGLIGLPLRYMHSPVEMVQISDVQAAAKLLAAFAMDLAGDQSFAR
jgi:putative aminopeptidase FrvX